MNGNNYVRIPLVHTLLLMKESLKVWTFAREVIYLLLIFCFPLFLDSDTLGALQERDEEHKLNITSSPTPLSHNIPLHRNNLK